MGMVLLAAEAAPASEAGLFNFDATLPLMAIQFLILVAILNAVFYKPLTQAIDGRAEYVRQTLEAAREREQQAQQLAQQYEDRLKEARQQSQQIVAEAQEQAQQQASDKIARAQQEVQSQREEAAEEVRAQKREALQSLEQQADALSGQILAKLVPEWGNGQRTGKG